MRTKILLLTLFFTIGFTFYNCEPICNCPPAEPFFDIKGFGLETTNCNKGSIQTGDVTPFQEVCARMRFEVDYISYQEPSPWNFSLMNTAMACSCVANGWKGAKTERLQALTVITLNDFDSEHLKNDTINDLLLVPLGFQMGNIDLPSYLEQDTSLIKVEHFNFLLSKAPELDSMYHYKVIVELSNGERYEQENEPIVVE